MYEAEESEIDQEDDGTIQMMIDMNVGTDLIVMDVRNLMEKSMDLGNNESVGTKDLVHCGQAIGQARVLVWCQVTSTLVWAPSFCVLIMGQESCPVLHWRSSGRSHQQVRCQGHEYLGQ
jgi:hypothetical protein